MVDEMYLEKATQYHKGEYVGADNEGNLSNGIDAFMIVRVEESIPYILLAIPGVKFSGEWLADKISYCTDDLTSTFYDTMHIMKNIRNNLLNRKKFVFPDFIYNDGLNIDINFWAGIIQWKDLHDIYDKEKRLSANLNKAPKLSY